MTRKGREISARKKGEEKKKKTKKITPWITVTHCPNPARFDEKRERTRSLTAAIVISTISQENLSRGRENLIDPAEFPARVPERRRKRKKKKERFQHGSFQQPRPNESGCTGKKKKGNKVTFCLARLKRGRGTYAPCLHFFLQNI